jgi:hypothetical protein
MISGFGPAMLPLKDRANRGRYRGDILIDPRGCSAVTSA